MFEYLLSVRPGEMSRPVEILSGEPGVVFTYITGAIAVISVIYAVYRLIKDREPLPLLLIVGGSIAVALEAMLDMLGHLWYPLDLPGPVYTAYGIHVPWLALYCYLGLIGIAAYFTCEILRKKLTPSVLFILWLVAAGADILVEMPMTAFGVHHYYGDVPLKLFGFPLAFAWFNGTATLAVGFAVWLVDPLLKGWWKVLHIFVPILAMGAVYGAISWPYFLALNASIPWVAVWALTLISLATSLLVVGIIISIVTRHNLARQLP